MSIYSKTSPLRQASFLFILLFPQLRANRESSLFLFFGFFFENYLCTSGPLILSSLLFASWHLISKLVLGEKICWRDLHEFFLWLLLFVMKLLNIQICLSPFFIYCKYKATANKLENVDILQCMVMNDCNTWGFLVR